MQRDGETEHYLVFMMTDTSLGRIIPKSNKICVREASAMQCTLFQAAVGYRPAGRVQETSEPVAAGFFL